MEKGHPLSARWRWLALILVLAVTAIAPGRARAHQPHDDAVLVAVSPNFAQDGTVFASTGYLSVTLGVHIVLRSEDAGQTWEVVPNFPSHQLNGFVFSPTYAQDATLFASSATGGLFRSTDGGDNWTNLSTLSLDVQTRAVRLSPRFDLDQTVVAIGIDGGVYKSTDRGDTWTPLPDPVAPAGSARLEDTGVHAVGDPTPKSVIAFSPNYFVDQTLFVALEGQGLFRSANGGNNWTPIGGEMAGLEITSLVLAPAFVYTRLMYAGTFGGGVYISLNAGTTWFPINTGLASQTVTGLTRAPGFLSNRTLYLSTAEGEVYRSTNWGATWTPLGVPPHPLSDQTSFHFRALRLSPSFLQDQTAFLPTFEGLWKTTNGGGSWRYVDILPTWLVRSMSISPEFGTDGELFASTYGGSMIRTADGAATWETLANGLISGYPDATAISDSYGTTPVVFAGTVWGPQRSLDGGDSWTFQSVLGTPVFARGMAMSPAFASDLTVAVAVDNLETGHPETVMWNGQEISTNGLFLSGSAGASWVPTQVNGFGVQSVVFSPDFAADGTLFASSLTEGLHRSTDGGLTWEAINDYPADCCLSRVAVSPTFAQDQTVFISRVTGLPQGRGLYRSLDGGDTWTKTSGSEATTLLDFVLSPDFATDGHLYAATLEQGVLRSTDGAVTLAPTGLDTAYVTAIEISPQYTTDQTLFAGTYLGTFKSTDAGASWIQTTTRTRVEEQRPAITESAGWSMLSIPAASTGFALVSDTPGETVTLDYVGTDVRLIGAVGPNFGIVELWLDGVLQTTVDLYSPAVAHQQAIYESTGVPFGEHTLLLVQTANQNPASSGFRAVVDAYDIWR